MLINHIIILNINMDIYDYVDKQEIEIHKTLQGITFIDEDDIIPSN